MNGYSNSRMMRRLRPALWLMLLFAPVLFSGCHVRQEESVLLIGDEKIPLDVTELDLRSRAPEDPAVLTELHGLQRLDLRGNPLSAEEISSLRSALPSCDILWDVPVAGLSFPSDAEELSFSAEQVSPVELLQGLGQFAALERLTLSECDYTTEERLQLMEAYPDVAFLWPVTLGGESYENSLRELDLSEKAVDCSELQEKLALFPALERVELGQRVWDAETLMPLMESYPAVGFHFLVELLGRTFDSEAEEIELNDIPISDTTQLEESLPLFSRLKKVRMYRCGLSHEEMDALNHRHEGINFVWLVQCFHTVIPTDRTYFTLYNGEAHAPACLSSSIELRYCHDMEALDFGHCAFHNAELECLYDMPKLKYLIIVTDNITDITPVGTLQELEYFEAYSNPIEDLAPLLNCKKLKHLNISHCDCLGQDDIEVLCQMKQLERLWFLGNYLDAETEQILKDALPNCNVQFSNYSMGFEKSGSRGWKKDQAYYDMRDALHMPYMD